MSEGNEILEEEYVPQEPEPPQYYVTFDGDNNIEGFYVDQIHGDNIPESAIPISEEEWQTYSADAHMYKLDGDSIREKTQQELDDEVAAQLPRPPTASERITELEAEVAQALLMIATGGIPNV